MSETGAGQAEGPSFVSRGGLKLHHALGAFGVDPAGRWCADLGCSTGGFTDCLLRAGAERVFAVDTAYGELAWTLRQDPRVVVMERTNVLHAEAPEEVAARRGVDLVVIDLGWTRQERAIPAAERWLARGGSIVSLVKPHYEVERAELGAGGALEDGAAERVARGVVDRLAESGWRVEGFAPSPIRGGAAGRRRKTGSGNLEWLVWLKPAA